MDCDRSLGSRENHVRFEFSVALHEHDLAFFVTEDETAVSEPGVARNIGGNIWHIFSLELLGVALKSVVFLKSVVSVNILSCYDNHILVKRTE